MSEHHHHHHGGSKKNIATAFFMNLGFAVFEVIMGLITGSIAIVSDAFHDFGDSLSLGTSWILEHNKDKSANEKYPYGYKKLSVVGAIINVFVLLVAIFVSMYQAINRFFNPEPIKTGIFIVVAIIGAVVNAIPIIKMKTSKTISERTVSLHLFEDVLTWCAFLVVGVIQHFTGWYFLDSCIAIAVCVVLLVGVLRNCLAIYYIIMDATPRDLKIDEVKNAIVGCNEYIDDIKDIKVRDIDGESYVAEVKLYIKPNFDISNLSALYVDVEGVAKTFDIYSINIQVYKDLENAL